VATDSSRLNNTCGISGNVIYNATGKVRAATSSRTASSDFVILNSAINLTNNQTVSFWLKQHEATDDFRARPFDGER